MPMSVLRRALAAFPLLWALTLAGPARAEDRSPTTAFLLSAGPGLVVHGLGHYYAGDRRTGGILLMSEIFGLALMNLNHPGSSVGRRITDRDEVGLRSGNLDAVGRVLFFGSWLYDLAKSGDAVRARNRRRQTQGFELGLDPVPEGERVSWNPRARYTVRF